VEFNKLVSFTITQFHGFTTFNDNIFNDDAYFIYAILYDDALLMHPGLNIDDF